MKYPNNLYALSLALAVTAGATAPAHALLTARSVPPASFLDYHVDTVPQLTFEVTYDKVVQGRLAHHFHLTGPAMGAYVRDNLVLQHLRAPLRTRVYCVSPRGREYFVLMTLKTGSPVFALRRTGKPILRLVCGNPLVAALPPAAKQAPAAKHAAKPGAKAAAKARVLSEKQAVQPAPALTADDTAAEAAPALSSAPTVTGAGPSGVLFTGGQASGSRGSGSGWLALLPAVGGLAALFTSHHGGGGSATQAVPTSFSAVAAQPPAASSPVTPSPVTPSPVTPSPITSPAPVAAPPVTSSPPSGREPSGLPTGGPISVSPDGPAPVPEPSPAWVFAAGGLALGALRLRRR